MCVAWNIVGNVISYWNTPFEIIIDTIIEVCIHMCITICVRWGKCIYSPPNMSLPHEPKSRVHCKIKTVFLCCWAPNFDTSKLDVKVMDGIHSIVLATKPKPTPTLDANHTLHCHLLFEMASQHLQRVLHIHLDLSYQYNMHTSLFHSSSYLCNHNNIDSTTLYYKVSPYISYIVWAIINP